MSPANADAKTGTALALDAAGGFDSYQRFNVGILSKPGGSGPLESKGLGANVEKGCFQESDSFLRVQYGLFPLRSPLHAGHVGKIVIHNCSQGPTALGNTCPPPSGAYAPDFDPHRPLLLFFNGVGCGSRRTF